MREQRESGREPRAPSASDQVCRRCSGIGTVDGATCPECGGSGHRYSRGAEPDAQGAAEELESYHPQPNIAPSDRRDRR